MPKKTRDAKIRAKLHRLDTKSLVPTEKSDHLFQFSYSPTSTKSTLGTTTTLIPESESIAIRFEIRKAVLFAVFAFIIEGVLTVVLK
jgi:hypothetical protein